MIAPLTATISLTQESPHESSQIETSQYFFETHESTKIQNLKENNSKTAFRLKT